MRTVNFLCRPKPQFDKFLFFRNSDGNFKKYLLYIELVTNFCILKNYFQWHSIYTFFRFLIELILSHLSTFWNI